MADSKNTPPNGGGKTDLETRVEIVTLSYEIRVLAETVAQALDGLFGMPEAGPVREEVGVIRKLAGQASEVSEKLDAELQKAFRPGGSEASDG